MHYKLRVDHKSEGTPDQVFPLMEKYFDKWAWSIEGGEKDKNPHFHIYGLMTKYKEAALRQALRLFNERGDYSLSQLDYIEDQWTDGYPLRYLAYMYKEGEVSSYGIPEEILDQARELSSTVTAESKRRRQSQKDVVNSILDLYVKNRDLDFSDNHVILNVYSHLISEIPKHDIPLRRMSLMYYIDSYFCARSPSYRQQLYRYLADRHWPVRLV